MHSLMNDKEFEAFGALLISEPNAWRNQDGVVISSPMAHRNWTKVVPSFINDKGWAYRSMIWLRSDLEIEQISVASSDITAAYIWLPNQVVLIFSVYIECADQEALLSAIQHISETATLARRRFPSIELIIAGDFNRHDTLWGGVSVREERRGEADPILDMMESLSLISLLPIGTITRRQRNEESTIDLMLATAKLADVKLCCCIHNTQHGSDHFPIETHFDLAILDRPDSDRFLFKEAPWKEMNDALTEKFQTFAPAGTQERCDRLLKTVSEIIQQMVPKARPSPYAKRWWSKGLTALRKTQSNLRNLVRFNRKDRIDNAQLELEAKQATDAYHKAIRDQKRKHWNDFLADETNIWSAARFLDPQRASSFAKVPPLVRENGSTTEGEEEKVKELLKTFYPPLPAVIEEDPVRTLFSPVEDPEISMEEVRIKVFTAKQWTAPGRDGLPLIVWRKLWPSVQHEILELIRSSWNEAYLPHQWREAKIIPLRKPDKPDYRMAKAWRPIALLSTLGKICEGVMAERLSYVVEKYNLLPRNHFGARRRRSAEQALTLIQEKIYKAWRSKKVLSLLSFDVKGAYNGVLASRLIQRMRNRRIPERWLRWIEAFCSNRSASVVLNGRESALENLPFPGVPQGSPLSPMIYLFFNADLVEREITNEEGSVAFIDDYTVWVTGNHARENRLKLSRIVDEALTWERRSGATFEEGKTAYIHFTRNSRLLDADPINIKGIAKTPQQEVKILGVLMDSGLRYKNHRTVIGTKGLKAAMALKRMRLLTPSSARQLFHTTVTSVTDYASTIWAHTLGSSADKTFRRILKLGAQAVTGAFSSVAGGVLEAEASVRSINTRKALKSSIWLTNLCSLPSNHPLSQLDLKPRRKYRSPLQRIKEMNTTAEHQMTEKIEPYIVAPWEPRIGYAKTDTTTEADICFPLRPGEFRIVSTAAEKSGVVGFGITLSTYQFSASAGAQVGSRKLQNPYTAELQAMSTALESLSNLPGLSAITLITANLSTLQALSNPTRQSGQREISKIYAFKKLLDLRNILIRWVWVPAMVTLKERTIAKKTAYQELFNAVLPVIWAARSTIIARLKANIIKKVTLPPGVGKAIKELDRALPGPHIKMIYDNLTKDEAKVIAQLRTGDAKLNLFLARIKATESAICACGAAPESVRHFLFSCSRWIQQRRELYAKCPGKEGNVRFFLGAKGPQDDEMWTPNMSAIRATICFVDSTKRFEDEENA